MTLKNIYCIMLLLTLVIIIMAIYGSWNTKESFVTQMEKYGDNDPCTVIRLNLTQEFLDKWFIGQTNGNKDIEPLLKAFADVLVGISNGDCKYKRKDLLAFLDGNEKSATQLGYIIEDIRAIEKKVINTSKTGILDILEKKYENSNSATELGFFGNTEGFTSSPYLEVDDIVGEDAKYETCEKLYEIITKDYFNERNLELMHQVLNGLERLLCECEGKQGDTNQVQTISDDIATVLNEKHGYDRNMTLDEQPDATGKIKADIVKIKETVEHVQTQLLSDWIEEFQKKLLEHNLNDALTLADST